MTKREEIIDRLAYRDWLFMEGDGTGITSYEMWCSEQPPDIHKDWSWNYLDYTEEELMAKLLAGAE